MRITPNLIAIAAIGGVIAAIAPFDIAFSAATFGAPVLRAALLITMVFFGTWFADRCGLRLEMHDARWPILAGAAGAIGIAVYVIAVDGVLFRKFLSPDYVDYFRTVELGPRLTYFMLRAFNENIIYRLFVFSSLAYVFSALKGARVEALPPYLIAIAMFASQMLNIGINVIALSPEPLSLTMLAYDFARYVIPGVVWAWIYLRFGFMTAEIASVGCHLFLQPALGASL